MWRLQVRTLSTVNKLPPTGGPRYGLILSALVGLGSAGYGLYTYREKNNKQAPPPRPAVQPLPKPVEKPKPVEAPKPVEKPKPVEQPPAKPAAPARPQTLEDLSLIHI